MTDHFYIDGQWRAPLAEQWLDVVNPATGLAEGRVAIGSAADVADAVAAARNAFPAFADTSAGERAALIDRIADAYEARAEDLAQAIRREMGAPIMLARQGHVPAGLNHIRTAAKVLRDYAFDRPAGTTLLTREPIGVVGLITPWNWPLNQITCKVAPALAAGCTVVLKPSEYAPLSAHIFAEILDAAGVPPGVFNLVHGDGMGVGAAIAAHPDIDMISFTGSTRAGVLVAKGAADTVKRVTQELGGKSPAIVLDDADIVAATRHAATFCFRNSGQSCNAPTRLLVPRQHHDTAVKVAVDYAATLALGDPMDERTSIGPVANKAQFGRVKALIEAGIAEGAHLACGGVSVGGSGFFVPPTVFAGVRPDMRIAREEIFGPVLSIIPYDDEAQAIAIANDTEYGLSAYVTSADPERARRFSRRIRAGMIHINGARGDHAGAFGGYKQSGNGREWGVLGFEEFLEVKSVFGFSA